MATQPGFVSVSLHRSEDGSHVVNYVQWKNREFCCDFICVTEDLAPRVRRVVTDLQTAASDHQPVLLELAGA